MSPQINCTMPWLHVCLKRHISHLPQTAHFTRLPQTAPFTMPCLYSSLKRHYILLRPVSTDIYHHGLSLQTYLTTACLYRYISPCPVSTDIYHHGLSLQIYITTACLQIYHHGLSLQIYITTACLQIDHHGLSLQIYITTACLQTDHHGLSLQIYNTTACLQIYHHGLSLQIYITMPCLYRSPWPVSEGTSLQAHTFRSDFCTSTRVWLCRHQCFWRHISQRFALETAWFHPTLH